MIYQNKTEIIIIVKKKNKDKKIKGKYMVTLTWELTVVYSQKRFKRYIRYIVKCSMSIFIHHQSIAEPICKKCLKYPTECYLLNIYFSLVKELINSTYLTCASVRRSVYGTTPVKSSLQPKSHIIKI